MAALPDADRVSIWRGLMRWLSAQLQTIPNVNKTALRAAVDATDDWIDSNQTSYNNALPATFRNNATLAQKTLLFCAVAAMRVSHDACEQILGDVD